MSDATDPTKTRRKARLRVEMAVGWCDDAKFVGLRWPTIKAFLRMMDYCRVEGTDGHVPMNVGWRCCGSPTVAQRSLETLITALLIERTATGFYLPGYLKNNRPHSAIVAQHERRSTRAQQHRSKQNRTRQQGAVGSLPLSEAEGAAQAQPLFEERRCANGSRRLIRKAIDKNGDSRGPVETKVHDAWLPLIRVDGSCDPESEWADAIRKGDAA